MIERLLDDYKNITEKIISSISNAEEVDKLMDEREELLKAIFSNREIKDEVKKLYLDKDLLKIDKELKIIIENEKVKVKEEIKNIQKLKNANNAYEKNKMVNNFFSTKI